jgi:hypothetical protein
MKLQEAKMVHQDFQGVHVSETHMKSSKLGTLSGLPGLLLVVLLLLCRVGNRFGKVKGLVPSHAFGFHKIMPGLGCFEV